MIALLAVCVVGPAAFHSRLGAALRLSVCPRHLTLLHTTSRNMFTNRRVIGRQGQGHLPPNEASADTEVMARLQMAERPLSAPEKRQCQEYFSHNPVTQPHAYVRAYSVSKVHVI